MKEGEGKERRKEGEMKEGLKRLWKKGRKNKTEDRIKEGRKEAWIN